MNAPFYKFGLFGDETSLIIAFIIGGHCPGTSCLKEWQGTVLFPSKPAAATPEALRDFEKRAQVAKYFGGMVQGVVGSALPAAPVLPKLNLPAAPASGGLPDAAGKPKKKKEGC